MNGPESAAGTLLTVARALRPDRVELLVDGERGDGLVELLGLAAARVAGNDGCCQVIQGGRQSSSSAMRFPARA